jgi:hypothetical protein
MFPLAILVALAIILMSADGASARKRHRHYEPSAPNKHINALTSSREKAAVSSRELRVGPTAPLMPKMVRTIDIKPERWADRWVQLGVAPAVSAELVENGAAPSAPVATNNWSDTRQPAYAMAFSDDVNATAANVSTGTLPPASPGSKSFDIYDVAAMIGGALVVFCGVGLWHAVARGLVRRRSSLL